jgi:ribosomal protein L9
MLSMLNRFHLEIDQHRKPYGSQWPSDIANSDKNAEGVKAARNKVSSATSAPELD